MHTCLGKCAVVAGKFEGRTSRRTILLTLTLYEEDISLRTRRHKTQGRGRL